MLCFWDLTVVESQAYIPPVGRVAGRARKTPKRPRRDGRIGVARPWLEAHRPSTRSYRNDRLNRHHETRTPPKSRQPRSSDRSAVGGPAADGRSAGPDARTRADRPFEQCAVFRGVRSPEERTGAAWPSRPCRHPKQRRRPATRRDRSDQSAPDRRPDPPDDCGARRTTTTPLNATTPPLNADNAAPTRKTNQKR